MVQPPPSPAASSQAMKLLSSLFRAARDVENIDHIIELTLGYIHPQFGFEVVWLALYDSDAGQLALQGYRGLAPDHGWPGATLSLAPTDPWRQALGQGRPFGVADLGQTGGIGQLAEVCQGLGLHSLWVYPLHRCNRCLGVVILASPRRGVGLPPEQRPYLAIAVDLAAQVLHCLAPSRQEQGSSDYQTLPSQHQAHGAQLPLAALYPERETDPVEHIQQLEQRALTYCQDLFQADLAMVVSWQPGSGQAQISALDSPDARGWVNRQAVIDLARDELINQALQSEGPLLLAGPSLGQTPPSWLQVPRLGGLVLMALRTHPSHQVTGLIALLWRSAPVEWDHQQGIRLQGISLQLAWSRRHIQLVSRLAQQQEHLEQLNWYKYHGLHRLWEALTGLADQGIEPPSEALGQIQQRWIQEQWHVQIDSQPFPLIGLLNRLIDRLTPELERRQLWSKVHHDGNVTLVGDPVKLELIIYRLLLLACERSPQGGRLDIWCRMVNSQCLELSITDDGRCSTRLIKQLQNPELRDRLMPSDLDQAPGLELSICQRLLKRLGGEASFDLLKDGRTHSRLLLPCISPNRQG